MTIYCRTVPCPALCKGPSWTLYLMLPTSIGGWYCHSPSRCHSALQRRMQTNNGHPNPTVRGALREVENGCFVL